VGEPLDAVAARDPEVEELDLAVPPDPDVVGLDVAVHEPERLAALARGLPRGRQRGGHLPHDVDQRPDGDGGRGPHERGEVLPVDELGDQGHPPVEQHEVEDLDDGRVPERGQHVGLVAEAVHGLAVGVHVGVQHLDGDLRADAAAVGHRRAVHLPEAAAPEALDEAELPGADRVLAGIHRRELTPGDRSAG
jgi:hypothetical protein